MTWCIAAGLATAAAWWVARPDDGLLLDLRLERVAEGGSVRLPPITVLVPVAGIGIVAIPSVASQIAGAAVLAAVAFGFSLQRRATKRRRAREFRAETAAFLRAWSGELRSGLAAVDAAHAAAGGGTDRAPQSDAAWDPIRVATSVDVPDALLAIASAPGGEALVQAAAAWSIADATGAPLASVLERVSEAVQASVDVDREVAVEAAPARATARLMAFLPVVGILLGTTLGADPVGVLFGTALGAGCLVAGLTLACIGVWWIERLVAAVEP